MVTTSASVFFSILHFFKTRKYEITAVERVLYNPGTLKIHLNGKLLRDITYQVRIGFETTLRNDTEESEPFYMKTYLDKTQQSRYLFAFLNHYSTS